jgi:hypothetical protein
VTVATATFKIAAGASGTIHLRLPAFVRGALASKGGRLTAVLSLLGVGTNPSRTHAQAVRLSVAQSRARH